MLFAESTQSKIDSQVAAVKVFSSIVELEPELAELIASLSTENSWGERQNAARKLGYLRCQAAVPALLDALPIDPFWMVRCAIIQALELIGDPAAVPVLEQAAVSDSFQVVRSYAAKAVERLS